MASKQSTARLASEVQNPSLNRLLEESRCPSGVACKRLRMVATQLPIHRFTGCGTPMIFRDCGSG